MNTNQFPLFDVCSVSMVSMRGVASDEERVSDIKKLLTCGTFYFAWSSGQDGPPIDLTLAAQKCVKFNETDNRFFWYACFSFTLNIAWSES